LNPIRHLLALAALLPAAALAGEPASPIVYNNMAGDGGVELDKTIREAYGSTYTIVNTSRAAGFTEPVAIAGDLPTFAKDSRDQMITGYVFIVYIVTAKGEVYDPVIAKGNDERLCRAALSAMGDWRFTPGKLKGVPVATTAAQEFNFGPDDVSNGLKMERLVVYQPNDVLVRRMPPFEQTRTYVSEMRQVAHNFFVGDTTPETLHIVVVTRPGRRSRVWFVSSVRPGSSGALAPLRVLLEAVQPLDVKEGPVILCLTTEVAGGDGKDPPEGPDYHNPVPQEWTDLARTMRLPPPVSSDAFQDRLWPPGG
jgi:Gram-negative bacterial TonB protein C-terminal